MPRYGYVIDESAALALLALDDSSIGALVAAFEMLAEQPAARPDSYTLDAAGRPLANKAFGRFLVGYWFEHPARRLHILRVDLLNAE